MSPVRADINGLQIQIARGGGSIVGFYQAAVIMIKQPERAPFRVLA